MGEGCHVVSSVGEAQHVVPGEGTSGGIPKKPVVIGARYHSELFDRVPRKMRRLNLLAGDVIETETV